jgi:hypothetical protein
MAPNSIAIAAEPTGLASTCPVGLLANARGAGSGVSFRSQWLWLDRGDGPFETQGLPGANHRPEENETASAGCLNVLAVTGSAAGEVAEFVVLSAKSVCRLMLLEAAYASDASFDPAMVLFKSIVQLDARPVTDVAAQCRADRAGVRIMPAVVTRSGAKPTIDRAERKNLWAAFVSRVALSIVSMRFPSRSIARYR